MVAEAPERPVRALIRIHRQTLAAARERGNEFRHAARVAVAVGAAYLIASLLKLPQGYWAVFTAVIVVQTSIGGTITASIERLLGTAVGGLVGVAAAYLRARTVLEEGLILSGAIAILAFAAAVRPSLRVAPVTAVIVIIGGANSHLDPLHAAGFRVLEIAVGSLVGLAATLFVFPARARRALMTRAAAAMQQLADLTELYARRIEGEPLGPAIDQLNRATRKAVGLVEQAAAEAAREEASGLRDAQVPDGTLHALWRTRNDGVMVERAVSEPLPPALAGLGAAAADLLRVMAVTLRASALAMGSAKVIDLSGLEAARSRFEQAVQEIRRSRATSGMSFEAAARVFGLVFALESLCDNLEELVVRIAELSGQPAPVAPAPAPVVPTVPAAGP